MHALQAMCYKPAMNKIIPLVLLLAGCSVPPETAPEHVLQVLSVTCDPNAGRPRADVTVRNVGDTTIHDPDGVVMFGSERQQGYFKPYPIRPGGTASLSTYASLDGSTDCSLESVTDGRGFPVTLRR